MESWDALFIVKSSSALFLAFVFTPWAFILPLRRHLSFGFLFWVPTLWKYYHVHSNIITVAQWRRFNWDVSSECPSNPGLAVSCLAPRYLFPPSFASSRWRWIEMGRIAIQSYVSWSIILVLGSRSANQERSRSTLLLLSFFWMWSWFFSKVSIQIHINRTAPHWWVSMFSTGLSMPGVRGSV